jgi:hypothetical protein
MTKDDLKTLLSGLGRGLPLFWAWVPIIAVCAGSVLMIGKTRFANFDTALAIVVVYFLSLKLYSWCLVGDAEFYGSSLEFSAPPLHFP